MISTATPAATPTAITPARIADQAEHHGSMQVFRVLSFRTMIAALAFFGLAGLAAQSAKATPLATLLIAVAAGAAAMAAV